MAGTISAQIVGNRKRPTRWDGRPLRTANERLGYDANATEDAMATPARHFTVRTLAEYWAVDDETVRRLIKARKLEHLKIGSAIRIPVSAVRAYEEANLHVAEDDPRSEDGSAGTLPRRRGIAADMRAFARARKMGSDRSDNAVGSV